MKRHTKKHAKKSHRRRRGGVKLYGFDIPFDVKGTVENFVSGNSTIADFAPGLQRLGPDYAPSKLIGDIDVKPYLEDYKEFIPLAEEFQQGLVSGLQSHGIGRRRRRRHVVKRRSSPKKATKKKKKGGK
jgi:hypothetical protein